MFGVWGVGLRLFRRDSRDHSAAASVRPLSRSPLSADGGASWQWTPVTQNSSADNLRPIIPIWEPGRTALLWARGILRSYTDYDLELVGRILEGEAPADTNR